MSEFTKMWRVKHDEPLNYNERIINSACDIIEKQEAALNAIWPFIEEDFPKGTGKNHGTCATDKYVEAANMLEQARKG